MPSKDVTKQHASLRRLVNCSVCMIVCNRVMVKLIEASDKV